MEKINIYVVTHKNINLSKLHLDNVYKAIGVGSKRKDSINFSDNTGINIANKNEYYCELTAQYWIWKNDKKSDIVGICHYRRFFINRFFPLNSINILNKEDIEKFLKNYDAIVPIKEYNKEGVYNTYLKSGRKKDLDLLKKAISELYPDYIDIYEKEIEYAVGFSPYNMIIARKKIFDEYSKWLFTILNYVEQRIDMTGYSTQEKRVFGYMGERLLGVWLKKNNIKVRKLYVVNTEKSYDINYYIKLFLNKIYLLPLVKIIYYNLCCK